MHLAGFFCVLVEFLFYPYEGTMLFLFIFFCVSKKKYILFTSGFLTQCESKLGIQTVANIMSSILAGAVLTQFSAKLNTKRYKYLYFDPINKPVDLGLSQLSLGKMYFF